MVVKGPSIGILSIFDGGLPEEQLLIRPMLKLIIPGYNVRCCSDYEKKRYWIVRDLDDVYEYH